MQTRWARFWYHELTLDSDAILKDTVVGSVAKA